MRDGSEDEHGDDVVFRHEDACAEEPPPSSSSPSGPVCSVLLTVVDHVMVPPSPLEPEEYREVQAMASIAAAETAATRTSRGNGEINGNHKHDSCLQGIQDQRRCALEVPVLRVFGPIIRQDHSQLQTSHDPPSQSACLYIHGAFPYMLARPVAAGLDGSSLQHLLRGEMDQNSGLSQSSTSFGEMDDYTDWDDVSSVEKILPVLHEALEGSIRSSMQVFGAGSSEDNEFSGDNQQHTDT